MRECRGDLPETNVVADGAEAMRGYTKNTRPAVPRCGYRIQ